MHFDQSWNLQCDANVEYERLSYKKISDTGGKICLKKKKKPEFVASRTCVEGSKFLYAWSHNIIVSGWFLGQNGWDWHERTLKKPGLVF